MASRSSRRNREVRRALEREGARAEGLQEAIDAEDWEAAEKAFQDAYDECAMMGGEEEEADEDILDESEEWALPIQTVTGQQIIDLARLYADERPAGASAFVSTADGLLRQLPRFRRSDLLLSLCGASYFAVDATLA